MPLPPLAISWRGNEKFLAYLAQMWNEGYIAALVVLAEEAGAFIGVLSTGHYHLWTISLKLILRSSLGANYLEVGTQLMQGKFGTSAPSAHAVASMRSIRHQHLHLGCLLCGYALSCLELGFLYHQETYRFSGKQHLRDRAI